jgi:pimeloyl-ACP methyl ester carboxylesterase
MRRFPAVAAPIVAALAAANATAGVRPGPPGAQFYTPPARLSPGPHGSLIWARPLTGPAVLTSAATNELLLYRSIGAAGEPVAVSGTVAIPEGRAPAGGWPVISWGHATVGLADVCAPTRADVLGGYERPLLNRWLRAGYAVVRTDYEGLGTPGESPDLVGRSEAHTMLDAVLAAHVFDSHLDLRRVGLAGHSVGGHAALWAAAQAPGYTPRLDVRATVAFAPSSHVALQAAALRSLTAPDGNLSAVAETIVAGMAVADPDIDPASLFTPQGAALFPLLQTTCQPALAAGRFANIAPAALFQPNADLSRLIADIQANDPDGLTIRAPVRIEQGTADTVVFASLSQGLEQEYAARGLPASYASYDGVDHFGVVVAAAADSTGFLEQHVGH